MRILRDEERCKMDLRTGKNAAVKGLFSGLIDLLIQLMRKKMESDLTL